MVNKHSKRCSVSLVIKEVRIETVMSYHVTPISKAKIDSRKCWKGCGEIRTLKHRW